MDICRDHIRSTQAHYDVTSPTRPCTHVLRTKGVECKVARLGTLRDRPLPRLNTTSRTWLGSRNLGARTKLPRATLNFCLVVRHMAAEAVRLAHSQRLCLACVQSAGNQSDKGDRHCVMYLWESKELVFEVLGSASTISRAAGPAWASPHSRRRITDIVATGTAADTRLLAFEGRGSSR